MNPRILFLSTFTVLTLLSAIWLPVIAQERITDEEQAKSIFEEVDDRRATLDSETAVMNMTITDDRGRTRNRTMQSWNRNRDDITESLIIFTEPGNVRGTGFLSINEDGESTQRLYLPTVGRIQVIGSAERGDRFMGSDFTYEDLGDQDPDSYDFEWLEEYENEYKIRASKPESDQYSHIEFDIDKQTYSIQTIYYYNEDGELIKRLESDDFKQLTDRLWSPSRMTMYDLREDRNTEIIWSDREVNVPIEDWRFTERGLRRGI